jgi:hypothetical protein
MILKSMLRKREGERERERQRERERERERDEECKTAMMDAPVFHVV